MPALDADLESDRPPPLEIVLEVARLAALRSARVLGRDELPGLAGLAEAAASGLGRPMGAVCFVDDDRLWVGASSGLDWRETPRAGSFSDEALRLGAPLVVPDALADPRFRDHPDVRGERRLRFYAGVPLADDRGYLLGTLCVLDREPGPADPAGLAELGRLAALASAALAAHCTALEPGAAGPLRVQGWLGVRTRGSSRFLAGRPGLIVLGVAAGSPAAQAGLRPTDVLLAIDGQELRHPADLVRALANRRPDGLARLLVLRAGQVMECAAAVAER